MKKGLSKLYLWVGSGLLSALAGIRFVLEIIGYATIADDAKEASGIVKWLFDVALALPWWAIWWPLFISYIWAGLVSFDFSFDIFRREPKPKPKSDAEIVLDRINSYRTSMGSYRNRHGYFATSYGAALAEIKMLWEYLDSKGFNIPPLPEDGKILEDVDRGAREISAILNSFSPYLKRGDLAAAKSFFDAS